LGDTSGKRGGILLRTGFPLSQIICSIGGNVAENSGGVHCLKYGVTTNHVMGLKIVLPDGSIIDVGVQYRNNRATI
jgi:FAD/FMN-containing dehydrogenase